MNTLLATLAGGLLAATAPLAPSPGVQQSQIGDAATFTFREAPLNALGVRGMEDLKGKPVLVAYWGHTTWADDWVQDLVDWQEKFGEDLAVVFVEMQGARLPTIESVAFKKRWLHSRAMWTTEYVVQTGLGGLPQYALVGTDGTILQADKSAVMGMSFVKRRMEEIHDAIAVEVDKRRQGPADLPGNLAAAWKRFAAGEIGAAFADVRAVAASAGEQPDLASAARDTLEEFTYRVERRLLRGKALLNEGRLHAFGEELAGLGKQLEGEEELFDRWQQLEAEYDSEDNAAEREASAELAKVEAKIRDRGLKSTQLKALKKMAKKHAGTRSAARAEHYLVLADTRP